ncbi:unnamed protein product [Lactuca virosa]|uniref:Uncharacterized protein n=1 Tax=Lactuca virosa TaxID=75947 RepID=A0AAU9PQL0_9ASTR|nr:unnamed protein product [Lactuca virosa]
MPVVTISFYITPTTRHLLSPFPNDDVVKPSTPDQIQDCDFYLKTYAAGFHLSLYLVRWQPLMISSSFHAAIWCLLSYDSFDCFPLSTDCFALDCLICASFDGYRHSRAYCFCNLSCAHCWTNGVWLLLTEQIRIVGVLRPVDADIYEPVSLEMLHAYQFNIMEKVD